MGTGSFQTEGGGLNTTNMHSSHSHGPQASICLRLDGPVRHSLCSLFHRNRRSLPHRNQAHRPHRCNSLVYNCWRRRLASHTFLYPIFDKKSVFKIWSPDRNQSWALCKAEWLFFKWEHDPSHNGPRVMLWSRVVEETQRNPRGEFVFAGFSMDLTFLLAPGFPGVCLQNQLWLDQPSFQIIRLLGLGEGTGVGLGGTGWGLDSIVTEQRCDSLFASPTGAQETRAFLKPKHHRTHCLSKGLFGQNVSQAASSLRVDSERG